MPRFITTSFSFSGIVVTQLASVANSENWAYNGDPDCWTPEITKKSCCREDKYPDTGVPSCWVEGYRYARCCGVKQKEQWVPTPEYKAAPVEDSPVEPSLSQCDYIVVGAGSGGSTVASRLETAYRVCVIDTTDNPDQSWSSEEFQLGDFSYVFGQGFGGTSQIGSGVYTRGDLADYEEWGGRNYWSVNRTLELFKSLEAPSSAPGFDVDYNFHPKRTTPGIKSLPVTLISPRKEELPEFFRKLLEVWDANLSPYRLDPHSGTSMLGLSGVWRWAGCETEQSGPGCTPQRIARNQQAIYTRSSQPVNKALSVNQRIQDAHKENKEKENKHVSTEIGGESFEFNLGDTVVPASVGRHLAPSTKHFVGTVWKVEVDPEASPRRSRPSRTEDASRVTGVLYKSKQDGKIHRLRANDEVILAAGVIHTPQILMNSGIGEGVELEALGIPIVNEQPEVGLHLQDHFGVSVVLHTTESCVKSNAAPQTLSMSSFLDDMTAQFFGFYEIKEQPVKFEAFLLEDCEDNKMLLKFMILLVTPSNQGRVILDSADPESQPRMVMSPKIHHEDLMYLSYGVKFLYRKLFPSLEAWTEKIEPSDDFVFQGSRGGSEEELEMWISEHLTYFSHPSGSVRYDHFQKERAPINEDLTVVNMPNLRICDASVFGKAVVGHTDSPTRMVGANCAKMILEERRKAVLPLVGYGVHLDKTRFFHVRHFLEYGGRLIDTDYDLLSDGEPSMAAAVSEGMDASGIPRDDLWLSMRVKVKPGENIVRKVKEMLPKFAAVNSKTNAETQVGYFDLILLQWSQECSSACHAQAWTDMGKLVEEGITQFIGVSNFDINGMVTLQAASSEFPIFANQIEFHPFVPQKWLDTKEFCDKNGIRVMGYGALGGPMKEDERFTKAVLPFKPEDMPMEDFLLNWSGNQGVTTLTASKLRAHIDTFVTFQPDQVETNIEVPYRLRGLKVYPENGSPL